MITPKDRFDYLSRHILRIAREKRIFEQTRTKQQHTERELIELSRLAQNEDNPILRSEGLTGLKAEKLYNINDRKQ